MAYSTNINLPKARARALRAVFYDQLPVSVVANKFGVHRTTIWRWVCKWREQNKHVSLTNANRVNRQPNGSGVSSRFRLDSCRWSIPTLSSAPHNHPNALPEPVVKRVMELRRQLKRCAEVIWHYLKLEGVKISLSSVRRILARHHEYDRPKYKKKLYRRNIRRPDVRQVGDLVETDVVHLVDPNTRTRRYIYTVIDLASRMAYAKVYPKLRQTAAIETVLAAKEYFVSQCSSDFKFKVVQSDNGAEFGRQFKEQLELRDIQVRHTRPHRPNDNAHIERFNRTLRQECIGQYMSNSRTIAYVQGRLDNFLDYYNSKRVHLSLECRTPAEVARMGLRRW